jgi:hypothetical protein
MVPQVGETKRTHKGFSGFVLSARKFPAITQSVLACERVLFFFFFFFLVKTPPGYRPAVWSSEALRYMEISGFGDFLLLMVTVVSAEQ